jgi:hypothetical protein
MSARPFFSPMLSVFDGRTCAGWIVGRGRIGWEAFTADEGSVGVFPTQREAANAIMRWQSWEETRS